MPQPRCDRCCCFLSFFFFPLHLSNFLSIGLTCHLRWPTSKTLYSFSQKKGFITMEITVRLAKTLGTVVMTIRWADSSVRSGQSVLCVKFSSHFMASKCWGLTEETKEGLCARVCLSGWWQLERLSCAKRMDLCLCVWLPGRASSIMAGICRVSITAAPRSVPSRLFSKQISCRLHTPPIALTAHQHSLKCQCV